MVPLLLFYNFFFLLEGLPFSKAILSSSIFIEITSPTAYLFVSIFLQARLRFLLD